MEIVEVNVHTAEQRLHTEDSFKLRCAALGVKVPVDIGTVVWPIETTHIWFRKFTASSLNSVIQIRASSNGGWGLSLVRSCELCRGTGAMTDPDKAVVRCWECHGTGKVREVV